MAEHEFQSYIGKKKNKKEEQILYKTDQTMKVWDIIEYLKKYTKSKYDIELSYDVVANEFPYFKTLGYTEWTGSLIVYPLNNDLKYEQITEAYFDNAKIKFDYIKYLKNRLKDEPNKYKDRLKPKEKPKEALVVLPGSNKLKKCICLNKLKYLYNKYGCEKIWFKPHPITWFKDVGELQDLFGSMCVLNRDYDLYYYLKKSKYIYTSHHSESVAYAVALNKYIEPIDVIQQKHTGAFSHINDKLFINYNNEDRRIVLNKIYNSYKSGIFHPDDPNWQTKLEMYIDYIMQKREQYKNFYIRSSKKKK